MADAPTQPPTEEEAREVTAQLAIPEEIREDALALIGQTGGAVWTRPGLEPQTRSLATMGILVARGQYDELAIHVRLGQERFGVSRPQICELILHAASTRASPLPSRRSGLRSAFSTRWTRRAERGCGSLSCDRAYACNARSSSNRAPR